jgi:hypothetical protein
MGHGKLYLFPTATEVKGAYFSIGIKYSVFVQKAASLLLRFITGGKLKFYQRKPQLYMILSNYIPQLETSISLILYNSHLFLVLCSQICR